MALRDQPYLPLYIQDFMTDEKLRECTASSVGVYIFIMCLLHKQDQYGSILLKQIDKQTTNQIGNIALKLSRHLPYSLDVISSALVELIERDVLKLEGDMLYQKRMVNDAKLSDTRASAGKKGGARKKEFAKEFAKAKSEANTEYEYESEYVIENELKGVKGEKENPYTPIPKVDTFRGMVMNFLQAPPINYIWAKDDTDAFVDISYKIGAVLANEGVPVTEQTKFEAFKMVIENLSEWTRLNRFQLTHLNKDWNANYQHARKQARKKQPNGSGVDAKAERVLD